MRGATEHVSYIERACVGSVNVGLTGKAVRGGEMEQTSPRFAQSLRCDAHGYK